MARTMVGRPCDRCHLEPLEPRRLLAVVADVSIDTAVEHQSITGFGACMIGWKNMPEYQTVEFYDQVVNDLGGTLGRIPIWPTFEGTNDNADPDTINWAGFNSNAIGPHLRFLQKLKERGVTSFFATAWVPPYWMKTNGNYFHGGHLRSDRIDEHAEYLAAFVMAAKRDFDIDIAAVSLQNEPFFIESYESAVYDPVRYADAVYAVQRQFERYELPTKLLVTEDLGYASRFDWWLDAIVSDPRIDRSRLILAAHYTPAADLPTISERSKQYGIPVWMTEISGKSDTWSSSLSNLAEITGFLVHGNASAYTYWQWSDVPASATSSLMNSGVPNNKWWSVKHLANWVRPGAVRVQSSVSGSNVGVSAFKHVNDNSQTIVFYNRNGSDSVEFRFNISGTTAPSFRLYQSTSSAKSQLLGTVGGGSSFTVTLPPSSMATLYSGPDRAPTTGSAGVSETIDPRVDPSFTNTLRKAALEANLANVQSLATTANVNNAFSNGWTPLFNAAASPYADAPAVMDHLLSLGANASAIDNEGRTPLHVAAANPLVRYGVAPSQAVDRLNRLLAAGADVNATDSLGRTPLHHAAMQAKFSFQGVAVQDGRVVQALLDAGANPNATDSLGNTPLDYAARHRNVAAQRALQGLPADTTAPTVTQVQFIYRDGPAVQVRFSEDVVPSFDAHDVKLSLGGTTLGWRQLATEIVSAPGEPTVALLRPNVPMAVGSWQLSMPSGAFYDTVWNRSGSVGRSFVVHLPGDLDGDGQVNNQDIGPFALALTDPAGYALQFPDINANVVGDLNGDGVLSNQDLAPFVSLLSSSRPTMAFRAPTPARPFSTTRLGERKHGGIDSGFGNPDHDEPWSSMGEGNDPDGI